MLPVTLCAGVGRVVGPAEADLAVVMKSGCVAGDACEGLCGVCGWNDISRSLAQVSPRRPKRESNKSEEKEDGFGKGKQCRAKFAGWQKRIGLGRAFSFSYRPSYTAEGFRQRVGAVFGDRRGWEKEKCSGLKEHG